MQKQTGKGIGLVIGMLIIIGVLIGAYVLGQNQRMHHTAHQTSSARKVTSASSDQTSTSTASVTTQMSHEATNASASVETASESQSSVAEEQATIASSFSTAVSQPATSSTTTFDALTARIMLYNAGVDSSSIDNQTLQQYWQAAQDSHTDFATYVKTQLK